MSVVVAREPAVLALQLADDCLVLSHRLAQWSSRAPTLEEDVALTNIALDLLGQARSLYPRVGELDGTLRSEDAFAYLRDEREFVNCLLVEQENGDFATTIARQLLFSTHQLATWTACLSSSDATIAAVAAKAVKEVAYHVDHATQWTLRLGDGTDESHRRMQAAVDAMWPYTAELFEGDASPRAAWDAQITAILDVATLARPATAWSPTGGRSGVHSECFGYLLAEMQHLHRSHPGASW